MGNTTFIRFTLPQMENSNDWRELTLTRMGRSNQKTLSSADKKHKTQKRIGESLPSPLPTFLENLFSFLGAESKESIDFNLRYDSDEPLLPLLLLLKPSRHIFHFLFVFLSFAIICFLVSYFLLHSDFWD